MKKFLTFLLLLIATNSFAATTYHVSKSGSNGNSCATAQNGGASAKLTIAAGISCMVTGDTLTVESGTYTESIDLSMLTGGNASTVTTIQRNGSDTVTIQPTGQGITGTYLSDNVHYVVLDGFVCDGAAASYNVYCVDIESAGSGPGHITIKNFEIKNWNGNAVFLSADNITFQNNLIHDQRSDCVPGNRWYGVYQAGGNNNLYDRNLMYNNPGGAMQIYPNASSGLEISNSIFHHNNTCSTSFNDAVFVSNSTSPKIHHNLFYANGTTGGGTSSAIGLYSGASNALVWNNTIDGHTTTGLNLYSGSSGSVIKNNAFSNNSTDISNNGSSTTIDHNRCASSCGTNSITTATNYVDSASGDFSLSASSNLINAGTASIATGITACKNNTNPAIGAIQDLGQPTATVNGTAAIITVPNNCTTGMLPANGVTGYTFKRAGSANTVTANVLSGTNSYAATLTNAFVGGDACLFSYSQTGNSTGNNNIGGSATSDQEVFAFTDVPCPNITNGTGSVGLTDWQVFLIQGATPSAWVAKCSLNAPNCTVPPGAKLFIAMTLGNSSGLDYPTFNYATYTKLNGGSFIRLVKIDGFGLKDLGNSAQLGTVVTQTTAMPANFLGNHESIDVAGTVLRTNIAIPSLSLVNGSETQIAQGVVVAADAVPGDVISICPYTDSGVALTCASPPTITIGSYQSVR